MQLYIALKLSIKLLKKTVNIVRVCRSGLDHFYSISYLWYSTLAVLVCVIVGLVVSLFTGQYSCNWSQYSPPGCVCRAQLEV